MSRPGAGAAYEAARLRFELGEAVRRPRAELLGEGRVLPTRGLAAGPGAGEAVIGLAPDEQHVGRVVILADGPSIPNLSAATDKTSGSTNRSLVRTTISPTVARRLDSRPVDRSKDRIVDHKSVRTARRCRIIRIQEAGNNAPSAADLHDAFK